jgi:hypothetical protein
MTLSASSLPRPDDAPVISHTGRSTFMIATPFHYRGEIEIPILIL